MPFVKLDCGILDSTIWVARPDREVFLTALLMAIPMEFPDSIVQLEVRSLATTGFEAPPGRYGFVAASGPGIVARAGVEQASGMEALERLGQPEPESRTPDFEGRRVIRIDGGYVVLNFSKYRDNDYTAAARQRRRRALVASRRDEEMSRDDAVTNAPVTRDITQAEAEAEVQADRTDARPVVRPRARAFPIVAKRRLDAAFEGPRVWVPERLHRDFVALRNHEHAERELIDFYVRVSEEWTTGKHKHDEPGAEMFKFWRARYDEWWPPSAPTNTHSVTGKMRTTVSAAAAILAAPDVAGRTR